MTDTTKTTDIHGSAFWAQVRAEREAQAVADRRSDLLVEREWERRDIRDAVEALLKRAVEKADAQAKLHHNWSDPAGNAYYRGKAEGLDDALTLVLGILDERDRADERGAR